MKNARDLFHVITKVLVDASVHVSSIKSIARKHVHVLRIVHVDGGDVRVNEVVHAEHGHVSVINGIANVMSISAIPATQQKSSTPSTSPKNGMAKCLREVVRMYVSNVAYQNEL